MSKKKQDWLKVTTEPTYNDKPIRTNKAKGYGCREDILNKIEERMDYATDSYRKTLCSRFDVRYPMDHQVPSDNKDFSTFLTKFNRSLKRKGNAPQYVAVREQSKEKHHHYHVFLITNQKNHQYPQKMVAKAEELWASTIGAENPKGLIDPCTKSRTGEKQPNSYRLNQNEGDYEDVKAKAFERGSYLAKTNTKGYAPAGKREVFCSRIPKNKK